MMSHIEMEYAKTLKQVSQLERELAEAVAKERERELAEAVAKEREACAQVVDELERELAEAKRSYMELIMSVENAYPNETRHETAKRYIQERENMPSHGPDNDAIKEMK